MAHANVDLRDWLGTTAFIRIHGTTGQQVGIRFGMEQSYLGHIPRRSYDTSEKVVRQVYKDCQISFRNNRYVVPHQYVSMTESGALFNDH